MIQHFEDDTRYFGLSPVEQQHYARRLAIYYGRMLVTVETRDRRKERRGVVLNWIFAGFAIIYAIGKWWMP